MLGLLIIPAQQTALHLVLIADTLILAALTLQP